MSLRVYSYAGCGTCKKALAFLQARGVAHEVLPIRTQPPTQDELLGMLAVQGGQFTKLVNASSPQYRASGLGARLAGMDKEAFVAALQAEGNFVKRPFVSGEHAGRPVALLGFKEEQWLTIFGGPP